MNEARMKKFYEDHPEIKKPTLDDSFIKLADAPGKTFVQIAWLMSDAKALAIRAILELPRE